MLMNRSGSFLTTFGSVRSLSGLLRYGLCDAHYTITDAKSYGCSSYHDGNACSNAIRVRRERVEAVLLGPLNENLGRPRMIERCRSFS